MGSIVAVEVGLTSSVYVYGRFAAPRSPALVREPHRTAAFPSIIMGGKIDKRRIEIIREGGRSIYECGRQQRIYASHIAHKIDGQQILLVPIPAPKRIIVVPG